uniref:Uncharacterized protein n=1 Tax=Lepeophtheirus salmonis TaxID=72036 RepID=A0A0K2UAG3_LEPSM
MLLHGLCFGPDALYLLWSFFRIGTLLLEIKQFTA